MNGCRNTAIPTAMLPIRITATFQHSRTERMAIGLEPAPRYWPTSAEPAVAIAKPGKRLIDSMRMVMKWAPSAASPRILAIAWTPNIWMTHMPVISSACGDPMRAIRRITSAQGRMPAAVQFKMPSFRASSRPTVRRPAAQPQRVPLAIPAMPCPPNGAGAKTNVALNPILTRFTTHMPMNGVRVSPAPRNAALMQNIAPLIGQEIEYTRMKSSA